MFKEDTEFQELSAIIGKTIQDNQELGIKFKRLSEILIKCDSAIVAFSGGVDSAFLAYMTAQLVPKYLVVTSDSPTLPRVELSEAISFASEYGLNHRIMSYNELEDDRFVKNDENRCFFCKDGLFALLNDIREKEGFACIFDGSNHDDLDDYRPGREAAQKNRIRSPLLEAEMSKDDIRMVSKALGLPTWDKPQMACLSSRFPRHSPISKEDLEKVEKAEVTIKALGYRDVRVRIHGDMARIEIGNGEQLDMNALRKTVPILKALGFRFVTLDLEGFRSGSLNE